MIFVPLMVNRDKVWWLYYKTGSQTFPLPTASTDILCLHFRGITLQAESKKEYEEVKILS